MENSFSLSRGGEDAYHRRTAVTNRPAGYNFEQHLLKLKDNARIKSFRTAILENYVDLIRDKVVVEVGCGLGILSIFCAQAGAKRVYAVEASELAHEAKKIVEDVDLSKVITVLAGDVKDVVIEEQVDVIVSDWMGHLLIDESMLGSVLTARDRWLKKDGLIFPSKATLYIAPVTLTNGYRSIVDFWDDVCGINMSAIKPLATRKPFLEKIKYENVLATPEVVKHVDCYTIKPEELKIFESKFQFSLLNKGDIQFELNASPQPPLTGTFNGFGLWFHVKINPNDSEITVLSHAAKDSSAPWKQVLLFNSNPKDIQEYDQLKGSVKLTATEDNSVVQYEIEYILGGD